MRREGISKPRHADRAPIHLREGGTSANLMIQPCLLHIIKKTKLGVAAHDSCING
jgi:hypothetical protein